MSISYKNSTCSTFKILIDWLSFVQYQNLFMTLLYKKIPVPPKPSNLHKVDIILMAEAPIAELCCIMMGIAKCHISCTILEVRLPPLIKYDVSTHGADSPYFHHTHISFHDQV